MLAQPTYRPPLPQTSRLYPLFRSPSRAPTVAQIRPKNPLKTVSRQPEPLKGLGLARDGSPLHPRSADWLPPAR